MKRKFRASFNDFHIDSSSGLQHNTAGEVRLPAKELAVLVLLVQNAGQLVSKENIVSSVWGDYSASDSSIARCISSIKSHLKKAAPKSMPLIKMIYGKGYKFIGNVTSSASFLCEESFSTLINASPDFILFKDGDGRWLSANDAALQAFGLHSYDWQGKTDAQLANLLPAAYRATLADCTFSDTAAWLKKIPSKNFELVPCADGSTRHYDVIKSPLFNPDGTRNILIIFGRDVTDLLQALERQKISEQVLDHSREAIVITDKNNNIVSVNRAFTQATGYSEADVIGKNPRILAAGRHSLKFYRDMWHTLSIEGVWRGEIWNQRKNGEPYHQWLVINAVHSRDGGLTNYIATFSDLTRPKDVDEKIEFLAYHDPLTRLPNRILLHDRFQQAWSAANRDGSILAMLFIDLDQFKLVNDAFGHETGDHLLKLVAQRLLKCVRGKDTVSRLGGDEFVVLLTEVDSVANIAHIADKIMLAMAEPIQLENVRVESTLSIGIAMYPNDGKDFDTLLHMADVSMYQAKNCGKNTYRFFNHEVHQHALRAQEKFNAS